MKMEHAFVASGFLNIEMYERHEPWWGIHSVPAWVHEIFQPLNTSPELSRLCLHNRGRNWGPLMSPSYEVLEWNRDFWLQDQDSHRYTPAALSRKRIRLNRLGVMLHALAPSGTSYFCSAHPLPHWRRHSVSPITLDLTFLGDSGRTLTPLPASLCILFPFPFSTTQPQKAALSSAH